LVNANIKGFVTSPALDIRQGDVLRTDKEMYRVQAIDRFGMETMHLTVEQINTIYN
jgi:hypothetical protein